MPILTPSEVSGMRADVLDTQLDMTCSIQRYTETGRDARNQPVYTWAAHLTSIPCHYWEEAEQQMVGDNNAVVTKERIVTEANRDIRARDRVSSVTGIDATVVATNLDILEVLKRVFDVVLAVEHVNQ